MGEGLARAWSKDGNTLALGNESGSVEIWRVDAGKWVAKNPGHQHNLNSVSWSPNNRVLALAGRQGVHLFDSRSGERLRTLGNDEPAALVAWSPDGKTIASGSGTIVLRSADSGKQIRVLDAPGARTLAWSPDGKILACGGCDGRNFWWSNVYLWDGQSGELLDVVGRGVMGVQALRWSDDGKTVVFGTAEQTLFCWDTKAKQILHTVVGPTADVFSPDGKYVAYAGTNSHLPPHALAIWETDTGQLCGRILLLDYGDYVTVSHDGHYRGSNGVQKELVYIVQTEMGQELLAPEEFSSKYGWKNDPQRVLLSSGTP